VEFERRFETSGIVPIVLVVTMDRTDSSHVIAMQLGTFSSKDITCWRMERIILVIPNNGKMTDKLVKFIPRIPIVLICR
jgi:hypothetical protein